MPNFEHCEDALAIADDEVIPKWHNDLKEARICYLLRDGWETKGRLGFAKINRTSAREKFLTGYDLIVQINEDVWPKLDHDKRLALIDHEFCHVEVGCDDEGETTYKMIGHDIEEFRAIVERHGEWSADIELFSETMRQTRLNFDLDYMRGKDANGTEGQNGDTDHED